MTALFLGVAIVLAALMLVGVYRASRGPAVFDRVLAVAWLGTLGVILVIMIGFIYGRWDMFVDIAIAYGLLNFVVTVALVKYFERGGGVHQ